MSTEEIKLRCLEVAKGQHTDITDIIKDAEKLYRFVTGSDAPAENRIAPAVPGYTLTEQEQ